MGEWVSECIVEEDGQGIPDCELNILCLSRMRPQSCIVHMVCCDPQLASSMHAFLFT